MNIDELQLVVGVGNYDDGRACIMSAAVAKWRLNNGEPLGAATDELTCVCPVIRRFAISLNDSPIWQSDDERTTALRPFIDKILNTRNPELLVKRAMLCADRAVRVIAPLALEARFPDEAAKLRALPVVVSKDAAYAAADAARAAVDAAAEETIKAEALRLLTDLCELAD